MRWLGLVTFALLSLALIAGLRAATAGNVDVTVCDRPRPEGIYIPVLSDFAHWTARDTECIDAAIAARISRDKNAIVAIVLGIGGLACGIRLVRSKASGSSR